MPCIASEKATEKIPDAEFPACTGVSATAHVRPRSDDRNTRARLVEILKQDQYTPLSVEKQVLIIFAGANRFLDDLEISEVQRFEADLFPFVETNHPALLKTIREKKAIDDSLRADALKALEAFKERFKAGAAAAD